MLPIHRSTARTVRPPILAVPALVFLVALPVSFAQDAPLVVRPAQVYDVEIVATYPHDREAFTQGLLWRDGALYESTGLNGRSSVRKVELETGKVLRRHDVDARHFGEGLTDWGDRLIQITWQTQTGFVYDLATFRQVSTFTYTGEGWGLARDDTRIIMSDGSDQLRFLDPKTLAETGRLAVSFNGKPVRGLNELEVVKGEIYANVWGDNHIVMIDPKSGRVTGLADLGPLAQRIDRSQPVDVLNGIAWDAKKDRLFVTGKLWPNLFEIRLTPRKP